LFSIAALAVLTSVAAFAEVNTYSTVVVFGDSLSDTGNVLALAYNDGIPVPVPGVLFPYYPPNGEDYTLGEFTDGPDTVQPANKHFHVWVEQLAAMLPGQPLVANSLSPQGTNYAYGFARTGNGTSPLSLGPYTVQVENIGQQISDYLATHPHIDNHTLFIIWGGAINLLYATSPNDVSTAATQQIQNLQRLIAAGATQILVPNLPPLGLVPEFSGSLTTSIPASAESVLYNTYLAAGIALLKDLYWYRHVTFYELDVFHLMLNVVGSPGSYSLTDVTHPAEVTALNPDTYLFWDFLHPTTTGHYILATAAYNLLSK
jgi:phospholipase/lecithinase/hemolysin